MKYVDYLLMFATNSRYVPNYKAYNALSLLFTERIKYFTLFMLCDVGLLNKILTLTNIAIFTAIIIKSK